jgi:Asp-tRNA(Asn)/Glu-tRNA(Gln) amidotransferase B subunit
MYNKYENDQSLKKADLDKEKITHWKIEALLKVLETIQDKSEQRKILVDEISGLIKKLPDTLYSKIQRVDFVRILWKSGERQQAKNVLSLALPQNTSDDESSDFIFSKLVEGYEITEQPQKVKELLDKIFSRASTALKSGKQKPNTNLPLSILSSYTRLGLYDDAARSVQLESEQAERERLSKLVQCSKS